MWRRRYKRRSFPKRRLFKRRTYRRSLKRKTARPQHYHTFTQYVGISSPFGAVNTVTYPISSTISDVLGSRSFTFNGDVPNASTLGTMFDQYRIDMVEVRVRMLNTPENLDAPGASTQNNNTNFRPTLYMVIDRDDVNTPTSISALKRYQGVKQYVLQPNKFAKIKFRPTVLRQLYLSAIATGYEVVKGKPWLDMAQQTIPHYGLKYGFDMQALTTSSTATITFQYEMECKITYSVKTTR